MINTSDVIIHEIGYTINTVMNDASGIESIHITRMPTIPIAVITVGIKLSPIPRRVPDNISIGINVIQKGATY